MRHLTIALAMTGLLAPLPALAQIESVDPDEALAESPPATDALVERLADPATQEQLATSVAVMSKMLLVLPLAPLAKAIADAGVATADDVPADTTLRKLAPGAGRIPDEIADKLPQAMGALASLAKGMEAMMPALEDMADRMKSALPVENSPGD